MITLLEEIHAPEGTLAGLTLRLLPSALALLLVGAAVGQGRQSTANASGPYARKGTARRSFRNNKTVTVRDFGAVPDGMNDQSAQIQQASDYLNSLGGGTMQFTAAKDCYAIKTGIQLYSNMKVQLDAGACVKLIGSATASCAIFGCRAAFYTSITSNPRNIHISGKGVIDGDRANNPGVGAGAAADCIMAIGWIDSSIEGITCKGAPSDGFTLFCAGPNPTYGPANTRCGDNILIDKVTVVDATRNGITVGGGTHITIRDSHLTYTHGSAPQSGLDVEPDFAGQYVTGLTVMNTEVDHNAGPQGAAVALNFTSEPKADFKFDFYSHDNALQGFAIIVPAKGVSYSGAKITGRYVDNGTGLRASAGVVLDSGGRNVVVSIAAAGSSVGVECLGVDKISLGVQRISGSEAAYAVESCTNVKITGPASSRKIRASHGHAPER